MLWKRKISVLAIWFVVTAGAVGVISRLPSRYRAEAVIVVDSQKIPEKFVSASVSTDIQEQLVPITQEVLSAAKLEKLIEELDLYPVERQKLFKEDLINMLRRDIQIRIEKAGSNGRTGAFRIAFQGPNAVQTARVVNRVATLFIDENLKSREVQATGTSEFIEAQLQEAKQRLDEQEAAVSRYKQAHSGELPQQENSLIGTLASLQGELEANRDSLNRAEQSKVILENALGMAQSAAQTRMSLLARAAGRNQTSAPRDDTTPSTVSLAPAEKASAAVRRELNAARLKYSEDHPDVKRLEHNLQSMLEQEAAAEAAAAPDVPRKPAARSSAATPPAQVASAPILPDAELLQLRERVASLESQVTLAKDEMARRKQDQSRILAKIADCQARIERLPLREQDMAKITRDYDVSKMNYKILLDKKLAADMASDMERRQKSERFTMADPARTPERPFKPNRPMLVLAACVAGLALGLVYGLGMELRQDRVLGEWELPAGVAVLGTLPSIRIGAAPSHIGWFRRQRKPASVALSAVLIASAIAGRFGGWF